MTALREPLGEVGSASTAPVVVEVSSEVGEVTAPMASAPPPPSRRHRRLARRRLVREQVLVALVLLILLAATVVLLCFEWLSSNPISSNTPPLLHIFGGSS